MFVQGHIRFYLNSFENMLYHAITRIMFVQFTLEIDERIFKFWLYIRDYDNHPRYSRFLSFNNNTVYFELYFESFNTGREYWKIHSSAHDMRIIQTIFIRCHAPVQRSFHARRLEIPGNSRDIKVHRTDAREFHVRRISWSALTYNTCTRAYAWLASTRLRRYPLVRARSSTDPYLILIFCGAPDKRV